MPALTQMRPEPDYAPLPPPRNMTPREAAQWEKRTADLGEGQDVTPAQAARSAETLRTQETPTVQWLWRCTRKARQPLLGAVDRLVRLVDRLNERIETGADHGTQGDGDAPDFSGLTCSAAQAIRACLCLAARHATAYIRDGELGRAHDLIVECLAECSRQETTDETATVCTP
jgi:hypothetical protein